jgi:tryptophan synthase alpha chain
VNRIDKKFKELKKEGKSAFIAYVTCGDPDLETSQKIIKKLIGIGADIIELGMPFSDPLADGPTIQEASEVALANKVTLDRVLQVARNLRKTTEIPLCLMSYYNPIFHYGIRTFLSKAKENGIDGLIIPDLPPDESSQIEMFARSRQLATIYFIAPTSSPKRVRNAIRHSQGFIYYLSLAGVTGARDTLPQVIKKDIKKIKKLTKKPVCVGFGISNPKQVRDICQVADGVIVGSAIINKIHQAQSKKAVLGDVELFVKKLIVACH